MYEHLRTSPPSASPPAYPHCHKNRVNHTPYRGPEPMLQSLLQRIGCQTASVGKLHFMPPTAAHAKTTGFDHVQLDDGIPRTDPYSDYVKWRNQADSHRLDRRRNPPPTTRSTTTSTSPSPNYIRQLPPPVQRMILRFKPAYDTNRELLQWMWRSYYAGVTMLDDEVGLILTELENIPNTAVFVLSDHGDQMLEHGLFGKNVFFDNSVKVPMLIQAQEPN